MNRLVYASDAKRKIQEAAEYYEGCKEALGQAFLIEVE